MWHCQCLLAFCRRNSITICPGLQARRIVNGFTSLYTNCDKEVCHFAYLDSLKRGHFLKEPCKKFSTTRLFVSTPWLSEQKSATNKFSKEVWLWCDFTTLFRPGSIKFAAFYILSSASACGLQQSPNPDRNLSFLLHDLPMCKIEIVCKQGDKVATFYMPFSICLEQLLPF